jgi:hypothetical protein
MPKFRKKPVVIEAFKSSDLLRLAEHDFWNLPQCIRDAYDKVDILFASDHIRIRTLEGIMCADRDDFVIRGVKGELYPCKPDVFEATYEPVDEEK